MERMNLKTIPAGSFWVGSRCALQLEVFLGTCVGVAAYDAEALVGGMIHLLLPEPPLAESAFQSEKYATTGLPLFLAAMQAEGAAPERLQVCLAGGALIGPLAAQDLALDIGGRTCEKALHFLRQEDILILHCETGGFMPTRMGLDMDRGAFSITPIGDNPTDQHRPLPAPPLDEIRLVIERIQPIPQVALRILRLVAEDDYRVSDLAGLVRQDQVIGARTLRLCNAAAFARQAEITSLEHALIFLGQDRLVQSVVAICVQDFFRQPGNGYSLQMGGMYQHAVGTALVAEQLARRSARVIPALAYTAGLLHDIGKVVLDQFVAARLPQFYRDLTLESDFLSAEKRHLGITHTAAGGQLALDWALPAPLRDAIVHHHCPEEAAHDAVLAHTIYIADLIMSRFNTGLELEKLDGEHLVHRFAEAGLEVADLASIVDDLPARLFRPSPLGLGDQSG